MSTEGDPVLNLSCQGVWIVPLTPGSYSAVCNTLLHNRTRFQQTSAFQTEL